MGWMVLAALLAGCGERQNNAAPEPPEKVKTTTSGLPELPPYEQTEAPGEVEPLTSSSAMQFFCRYTERSLVLQSLQSSSTSTRDRYLMVMDNRAEEEGIDGWPSFRASYLSLGERDRDIWFARNIAKHSVEAPCKHLLSGRPLNAFMGAE